MSSTASSTDFILLLQSIQRNLYRFGGPVLMFLGNVSCILSFIVFTKKNLRKSPCANYFAAINISNLCYIYWSFFFEVLANGYDIQPTVSNTSICRLSIYASFLFESFGSSFLFFASVDRILITSPNAQTRQRSTRRLALICIIGTILFWVIFHIHALILVNIQEVAPYYYICYFQQGLYIVLIGYYSALKAILTPIIMITCGLWTVKNIRSLGRPQIAPNSWVSKTKGGGGQQLTSSKDRQLLLMLLIDIVIFIVFGFVLAAILMEQQITQYQVKDFQRVQLESFIVTVGSFSVCISFAVSFYTNLLVSKTFRNEVKSIFTG